jgi:hypothetical protein
MKLWCSIANGLFDGEICFAEVVVPAGALAFPPGMADRKRLSHPRSAGRKTGAGSRALVKRGGTVALSGPPRQFWVKVND